MQVFEVVIAMLLGGAALAALARRVGAPYPALVALAGAAVVRAAMDAQRQRLVVLRADGTIGDAAFQRVEEELDWTELGWAQVVGPSQPAHDAR